MNPEVETYYNKIASNYDQNRFANSYGSFIDFQEKKIINRWLSNHNKELTLDLGCGTGRFLSYAKYGHDVSPEMISEAKKKFPNRILTVGGGADLPYPDSYFESAISFHVFMHLDKGSVEEILNEVHRVLKSGGKFIFDVPAKNRRKLLNYKAQNWHGANDYYLTEIKFLLINKWQLANFEGIMWLPIHRLPIFLRPIVNRFDNLINRTFLKKYSSYWAIQLVKK